MQRPGASGLSYVAKMLSAVAVHITSKHGFAPRGQKWGFQPMASNTYLGLLIMWAPVCYESPGQETRLAICTVGHRLLVLGVSQLREWVCGLHI